MSYEYDTGGSHKRWRPGMDDAEGFPRINNFQRAKPQGRWLNVSFENNENNFSKISSIFVEKQLLQISGYFDINSIRRSKDGCSLQMLTTNQKGTENFLKTKKLGEFLVKIEEHKFLNHCKGVIFSKDVLIETDDDLKQYLADQMVVDIYRMKRRGTNGMEDTGSFILTFDKKNLPEYVNIGYLKVKVRQYIPNPLQCKNCFRFGHIKAKCVSPTICYTCAEIKEDEMHDCSMVKKCVNCNGPHNSLDRKSCNVLQKEIAIIETKTKNNISFYEAKKMVMTISDTSTSFAGAVDQSITEELAKIKAQLEAVLKDNTELRKENEVFKANQKTLVEELAKKMVKDYDEKQRILEHKLEDAVRRNEEADLEIQKANECLKKEKFMSKKLKEFVKKNVKDTVRNESDVSSFFDNVISCSDTDEMGDASSGDTRKKHLTKNKTPTKIVRNRKKQKI